MISTSTPHFPESCIIKAEDISSLQEKPVYIDATFVLPNSEEDIHANFTAERLPGAVFFDIEDISDKASDLPHMLPCAAYFEEKISALGLKNADLLVIYGQHGMIMGPARIWWTFRVFGHEKVLVLDGGLPAWKKAGLEMETGELSIRQPSDYKVKSVYEGLVSNIETLRSVSSKCLCPVLDARPAARFAGTSPEPRKNMRSGHIPNSLNLPCSSLVKEDGTFKEKEEIIHLINQCGLDLKNEPPERVILSCGSGITACALALALHHSGFYNSSVYDGSWGEWGREDTGTDVAMG